MAGGQFGRKRQLAHRQNRGRGVGASQCRRGRAQSGDTAQAMVRSCRHAVCRRRKSNDGVHELPRPIRRQLLRRRVHAHQHLVPRGKQKQPEGGPHLVPERAAGTEEGAHPSFAASEITHPASIPLSPTIAGPLFILSTTGPSARQLGVQSGLFHSPELSRHTLKEGTHPSSTRERPTLTAMGHYLQDATGFQTVLQRHPSNVPPTDLRRLHKPTYLQGKHRRR